MKVAIELATRMRTLTYQRRPNNRVNSDWQFRSASLPTGCAERSRSRGARKQEFGIGYAIGELLRILAFCRQPIA